MTGGQGEGVRASTRERLDRRVVDRAEDEGDVQGVARSQDPAEGRRLPGEQVAVGAHPGLRRRRRGRRPDRTVGSRNTYSVAMATHRSRGLTGSPRSDRAARTASISSVDGVRLRGQSAGSTAAGRRRPAS